MLITSITIENFKGIAEPVTIPLRPLTLLFGKNSAGKSTILQAMLYALEIIKNGNCDPDRVDLGGTSIDLGGFANLVHNHETDRTVRLRFDLDLSGEAWVRPEGTMAAEQGVKRREFRINEYIPSGRKGFENDLSMIGDDVESAWIDLSIGIADDGEPPSVLHWEVGFDGVWLARVGRYRRRWETDPTAAAAAVLNEVHPLLVLLDPESERIVESVYGMMGTYFQTHLYTAYFMAEEVVPHSDTSAGDSHLRSTWQELLDIEDFVPGSLRCVSLGEETQAEVGILKADGCLDVRRLLTSDTRAAMIMMMQYDTVDEHPKLEHIGAHGMPDWKVPFSTGWPISILRHGRSSDSSSSSADAEDDGYGLEGGEAREAARFLDQLLERLIHGPLVWLRDELDSIRYVGPLRELPLRGARPPRTQDRQRWSTGLAAWDALSNNPELVATVNDSLANILKVNYELVLRRIVRLDKESDLYTFMQSLVDRYDDFTAEDYQAFVLDELEALGENELTLRDTLRGIDVAPSDIGVGISQVLPVVTGAFAPGDGDGSCNIFAIEQPELHVHPAVQVGLGDVFIQAIRKNPNRLMLIETHSEHMTLRLMRRMRETYEGDLDESAFRVTPEDIGILFVEIHEGRMIVRAMPLNKRGELVKAWPGGFFEEGLEEVF